MKTSAIILSAAWFSGLSFVQAASVTITNPSFEADLSAVQGGGGWSDAVPTGWSDPAGASNGNFMEEIGGFASTGVLHLGFDTGSDGGLGMIYQDLSTAWAPNTKYTLTVAAGNRSGWGAGTGRYGFGSSLDAAPAAATLNVPSLYHEDKFVDPGSGLFADTSITFTTGAVAPAGNIRISIQRVNAGSRLHIDNVRLDATPIPEPGSVALLGVLSGLAMRRRRA